MGESWGWFVPVERSGSGGLLFQIHGNTQKLTSVTSAGVISVLKAIFSCHSIPVKFRSDNGQQFTSQEMNEFAERYCFTHTTSSPHYPKSNSLAERMVKTANFQHRWSIHSFTKLSSNATSVVWIEPGRMETHLYIRWRHGGSVFQGALFTQIHD